MNDTALLIIDIQVGNFSDSDPIYNGDKLLAKIKSLIDKARLSEIPIIYIQNCGIDGSEVNNTTDLKTDSLVDDILHSINWNSSRISLFLHPRYDLLV